MKNIFVFLIAAGIIFSAKGQSDNELLLSGKMDQMTKSIIQLEQILQNHAERMYRIEQNQTQSDESFLPEESIVNIPDDVHRAENENNYDTLLAQINKLDENYSTHQNSQNKTFKRLKMHFILVYIICFVLLMGLIFLFLYFTKFFREYELFQKTCIENSKNEMKGMLTEQHDEVRWKTDNITNDVRTEQEKLRMQLSGTEERFLGTMEEQIALLLTRIETLEKNIAVHATHHAECADLKSDIEELKSFHKKPVKNPVIKKKAEVQPIVEQEEEKPVRRGRKPREKGLEEEK